VPAPLEQTRTRNKPLCLENGLAEIFRLSAAARPL
jgi:hypothetical protein